MLAASLIATRERGPISAAAANEQTSYTSRTTEIRLHSFVALCSVLHAYTLYNVLFIAGNRAGTI